MQTESFIPGKDASLEFSIATMQQKLPARGFFLEESWWLNPAENIWSVHMRDKDCPLLFTNGKGASELAARARSASSSSAWAATISGPTSISDRRAPSVRSCTTRKNAGSPPPTTAHGRPNC